MELANDARRAVYDWLAAACRKLGNHRIFCGACDVADGSNMEMAHQTATAYCHLNIMANTRWTQSVLLHLTINGFSSRIFTACWKIIIKYIIRCTFHSPWR